MNRKLVILKLGGSCLTYKKEGLPKIRQGFLPHICQEIKKIQEEYFVSFIVIHGGGSITHPLLNRYHIVEECKNGIVSTTKDKLSAAKVHLAMNLLNKAVVTAFLDQDIPAWPIQTSALFTSSDRKIRNISLEPIVIAMQKGFTPILHGDFIIDKEKTICICSGDFVACLLAQKLKVWKVLFASDVDGVYSENPRLNKKAKLIRELNSATTKPSHSSTVPDHSGGIGAKLDFIKKYCHETGAVLFNGIVKGNLAKALSGDIGTKINSA